MGEKDNYETVREKGRYNIRHKNDLQTEKGVELGIYLEYVDGY